MRLLIVEDDLEMAATIQEELQQFYAVDAVHDGAKGVYQAVTNQYDLIILDVALPDVSGVTVCTKLRERNIIAPILMLTGQAELEHKLAAFNAGADDYLTKPFSFAELKARSRALLRRHTDTFIADRLQIGDLEIDVAEHRVTRQGKDIYLRRKEFSLLEYLLRHRGQVVTRSMIIEHVWDDSTDPLSNTVDVHINHLREKIDRPFRHPVIQTVPGLGYRLDV